MTVDKEAILDVLESIKDYFENKADADHDENGYIPNKEMGHSAELTLIIQQVASLIKERDELKEIIKQMTEDFAVKVQEIKASNEAKEKEYEYWKQRCELSELMYLKLNMGELHRKEYKEWQQLKNQTPNQ